MTDKQTVLEFFNAETEAEAKRHIYKYTDCGAWIHFTKTGVEIGSIVEGCDFGTAIYPLTYGTGFTGTDIQGRINAVEAEASDIWEWMNVVHEGDTETHAEMGIDCPDTSNNYAFETNGRSS